MAKGPKAATQPKPLKLPDPNKAIVAPPRLKPTSTREYGKGGTPLAGNPDMGIRGGGASFGGPTNGF
jgi:hypothetical protein